MFVFSGKSTKLFFYITVDSPYWAAVFLWWLQVVLYYKILYYCMVLGWTGQCCSKWKWN